MACHQFGLLERMDVLERAQPGGDIPAQRPVSRRTSSGTPSAASPATRSRQGSCASSSIDADRIARERRPARTDQHRDAAVLLRARPACCRPTRRSRPSSDSIAKTLRASAAESVVERTSRPSTARSTAMHAGAVADRRRRHRATPVAGRAGGPAPTSSSASRRACSPGEGDLLPVSALPVDGTFPTGTARLEKRKLAVEIPIWEPDLCIDCGKCAIVCPHAAIRMKVYDPATALDGCPGRLPVQAFRSRGAAGPPADDPGRARRLHRVRRLRRRVPGQGQVRGRAQGDQHAPSASSTADVERERWDYFLAIPELDRTPLGHDSVKNVAAAPAAVRVLRRLRRLRRDAVPQAADPALRRPAGGRQRHRLLVDLRRQPADHAVDHERRRAAARPGPTRCSRTTPSSAWACGSASSITSARPAVSCGELDGRDRRRAGDAAARRTTRPTRRPSIAQRARVAELLQTARAARRSACRSARSASADELVRSSTWIVGGDGWAYDIGFGGLDHVLGSGRNVNVLVLDTEVYSNTGGQASKATPRGAVAKFATAGKADRQEGSRRDRPQLRQRVRRAGRDRRQRHPDGQGAARGRRVGRPVADHRLLDLHRPRHRHGDVDGATRKTPCAVGYWPLYRYHPSTAEHEQPFQLDSAAPSIPLPEFALKEARFAMLARTDPERSAHLLALAQADDRRAVALLRAAGRRRTHVSPTRCCQSVDARRGRLGRWDPDHDRWEERNRDRPATEYLGLALRMPHRGVGRPAHRPTSTGSRELDDAGVGAVVLPSLFEEQIEHDTARDRPALLGARRSFS